MRKLVLVICLLVFFAGSPALAQTWLSGSINDALTTAKSQGKLLLLDFFASSG